MIINNKSVRGIYPYNESAEYEKGDFVVDGDCIFICTANYPTDTDLNTVKGQKPIENGKINTSNYKAYPGDLVIDPEEYYEIVQQGKTGVEDKYVSSQVLNEVLRKSFFGIDEAGVITDYVLYTSEDNTYDYSIILGSNECMNLYLEPGTYSVKELIPQEYNLQSVTGSITANNQSLTVVQGNSYQINFTNNFKTKKFMHAFGDVVNTVEGGQ